MDDYVHGAPCFSDLATSEPRSAKSFYAGLFGWEYEEIETPGGPYAMARLRGRNIAGIYLQAPEEFEQAVPPHWNTLIRVDDVDAAAGAVEGAGGSLVVRPFDAADHGRMAQARDPGGSLVWLWEPRSLRGAQLVNEPGTPTWHELVTADPEACDRFYSGLFGWHSHVEDMGGVDYTVFHITHDHPAGGMVRADGELPPGWVTYFAVEDCDEAVKSAVERGGRAVAGPADFAAGRYAVIADPQGATFAVIASAEAG